MIMSYLSSHPSKPKMLFIHIPKTAGTSVEDWFCKVYGNKYVNYYQHAPISYKNLNTIDAYKFSIIRNPYSRAVSWYQQALSLILRDESEKIFNIEGLNMKAWEKGFDYFIQNFFDRVGTNPNEDILISPAYNQLDYITINNKIAINKFIKFENIDQEFKEIEKITKTNYGLEKWKVGPSEKLRDWKSVYTSNSKKLIEEIYKKDFDFFGYNF